MTRTIADQYLAQNAGRRYPFKDDTELPDWLPDSGVLDFRCTLYGVGAGTAPEARLVNVAHVGDGDVRFTVDLSAGGVAVDTIRFLVPSNMSKEPYTAYASGDRSTGALTVTAAAIPPGTGASLYDAEVEYLESTGTQWIDTELDYFADFEIGIRLRASVANKALGTSATMCMERYNAGNPYWQLKVNDVAYTSDTSITDYHVMAWRENVFTADGVTVRTVANPFAPGAMVLFGVGGKYFPNMIYACKLWDSNGIPVRDFIPVRVGTEGAMYDRVTKQLFRNAGSRSFLYGDDVAPGPAAGEYPVSIPFAATTVVCDSLKVMRLQSAHDVADARDEGDPAGLDPIARLTGEIVLAEGRNAEPYLDGNRLRLDIRKGAGLGENCQAMASSQTCDNVLFTINGERPGSDGNIRIAGENGVSVTARPGEHAITIKLDDVARDRLAKECASTCNGG